MSFMALVTDQYDAVVRFYGRELGFPVLRSWDRQNGRGCVFDARGLGLEILDNQREASPRDLTPPDGRLTVVIEVDDVADRWARLGTDTARPEETSWGARLFRVLDPDGVQVTFVEWLSSVEGGESA